MKAEEALEICKNLNSDRYSPQEKLRGITEAWKYTSRSSLTKPVMANIITFLLAHPSWKIEGTQEQIPNAKFLPVLSARCQEILKWRYGQMDGVRRTLYEIGEIYGVTRERVRQLEYRSLSTLSWYAKNQHHPEVKEKLRMYGIEVDDEKTD